MVNLDWKMGNGKPVKAYLQPNDITVLEVRKTGRAQSGVLTVLVLGAQQLL